MTQVVELANPELTLLHRYQKLIDLSRDLASTLDLDLLLDRIVDAAAELTGSEAASILLTDDETNALYFQAASNLDRPFMRGLAVPLDNSIAGWIVKNRNSVIVDDPQNDPRFYSNVQQQSQVRTRNLLGVPLIVKEKVIGVLEAINKQRENFSSEDEEILSILGSQAAIAIQNTRLFNQSDVITEVVHEIRTPLASVMAAGNLLLRQDLPEIEHDKIVGLILAESQRLAELTTQFLDFARLESGRMEFRPHKIDLPGLLTETVDVTSSSMESKEIELIWEVPENFPEIIADPDRLKQAVLNLLTNAVKYNKAGGTITIGAEAEEQVVIIYIRDTGIGISKQNQKNLFGKFYRVPGSEKLASGTGLGLSIVNRIIRAHGGDVLVDSDLGKGSTFTIRLPRH